MRGAGYEGALLLYVMKGNANYSAASLVLGYLASTTFATRYLIGRNNIRDS